MAITFQAVYENGVFHPTQKVSLPEHCQVVVEIHEIQAAPDNSELDDIYALLAARFDSGESDVAARPNELSKAV
jgi:predicted DNA-binding antitoxin AbrB/MazE fold protein